MVGTVHWRYWQNDVRKPILLIIPPTATDISNDKDNKQQYGKNKKQKKGMSSPNNSTSILPQHILDIPKLKKNVKFRILLHFGMESIESWIPPLRLVPNRCNIKRQTNNDSNTTHDEHRTASSCFYNNNVLMEDAKHTWFETAAGRIFAFSKENDDSHNDHANNHCSIDYDESWYTNWNAATILIKIWALQRGLLRGHDALTIDIIVFQLLYLFRTKLANPIRMTPIQILTAWFKLIADTNWLGDNDDDHTRSHNGSNKQKQQKSRRSVLVLPLPGKNEKQTIAMSKVAKIYAEQAKVSPVSPDGKDPATLIELYQSTDVERTGPVFLDPSMLYNYAGRLSPSYTRLLQREAQKSLDCIHSTPMKMGNITIQGNTVRDPFTFLFMTAARFWKRHDMYVRINLKDIKAVPSMKKIFDGRNQMMDNEDAAADDLGKFENIARSIVKFLTLALGDRIRAICPFTTGNGSIQRYSSKNTSYVNDSDEIPTFALTQLQKADRESNALKFGGKKSLHDPTGSAFLTLGISLNPDTCFRLVDRGPPADHVGEVQAFLDLWGRTKAELRRFKDGAIVHAVVWDTPPTRSLPDNHDENEYVQFQNDDKWQGGIIERIVEHVLSIHFLKGRNSTNDIVVSTSKKSTESSISSSRPQFALRNINSIIDGVALHQHAVNDKEQATMHAITSNPLAAHRMVMKAYENLATFLRKYSSPTIPVPGLDGVKKSVLQIPLAIDAVEPLSPALRYAELYPPVPHPFLGTSALPGMKKASGAVQSNPIKIQIRFGASSKWPADLKAIGAAKTAMLIALVNSIESLKNSSNVESYHFDGPTVVTSSYADIGYMGFVFRIYIRADPELKLLRGLRNPSPEAMSLLHSITRKTVFAATHHTIVHAVYTSHPSSSATLRLARRWIACHLLSDHIPFEALELLVAHVYTNRSSPLDPPGTVTVGFQRFLNLLASHNWKREPLIVDPQGHFNDNDHSVIWKQFESIRGTTYDHGPAMYIISPCNRGGKETDNDDEGNDESSDNTLWTPVYTAHHPEIVVLNRTVALAERTYSFLFTALLEFQPNSWSTAFQESTSAFRSYCALLRVDPAFLVDKNSSSDASNLGVSFDDDNWESSYTRSMIRRMEGPRELRRRLYRNIVISKDDNVLLEWRPAQEAVQALRAKLGPLALFFYNDLCPDVLAVVWRRPLFQPRSFSAINSEYVQPVTVDDWKSDTMVTLNVGDILRETALYTTDIVVAIKVFDTGPSIAHSVASSGLKRKKNNPTPIDQSSCESIDSDGSDDE